MGTNSQVPKNDSAEFSEDIMAEINITPLTDVFLVLLVIFMVTTPLMSQMGMDVKLPKSTGASSEQAPPGVIVTLLASGKVRINQKEVSLVDTKEFEANLGKALTKTTEKLVVLEGDEKAFLGSVVEVMDRARKAGALRLAIATQPK